MAATELDQQPLGEPETPAASRTPAGDQTYVVQKRSEQEPDVWTDVATVTVPPRTKRRTIIERALELTPTEAPANVGDTATFRVLDSGSAAEVPVALEVPSVPQLRIG